VYAMVDPKTFGERMVGLNLVPEPLWWLLGAVVGFYFGAREAYYFRRSGPVVATPNVDPAASSEPNPALEDWRSSNG
ncbi:3TM-type holin, partial [Pseudorhodobacter sp.]|uniref:3TM-type holin n=1 Tax=Pseudorhodobacter sp. TaxID=1934400 RepID=UPI00264A1CF4